MSVHRCRQNSRVLTSGQPKKKQNCRQFSTEIRSSTAMASPVPISLLSKPCFSLQQAAGLVDYFFPSSYRYPLLWLSGSDSASGTPRECWWQNGICWSYSLSREKCVLIPHEVLWQVRNYAKKMWLRESQSTNTDLWEQRNKCCKN